MSAALVTKAHIDSLVSLAFFGPTDAESTWYEDEDFSWAINFEPADENDYRVLVDEPDHPSHRTPQQLGELLWQANALSVANHHQLPVLPDDMGYDQVAVYMFTPVACPKTTDCFSMISSYEYHSNETIDWVYSEAQLIMQALKERLIDQISRDVDHQLGWIEQATPRPNASRPGRAKMLADWERDAAAWNANHPDQLDHSDDDIFSQTAADNLPA